MASSLNRTGESRPATRKGHGTAELGPSDSTDTGSDVRGGPGFRDDVAPGLNVEPPATGEAEDVEGAGPDLGDRDLDSDSDRFGTGERAAAGRDSTSPVDNTLYDDEGNAVDVEDLADDASLDTTLKETDDRDAVGNVERDTPTADRGRRDSTSVS